MRYQDVDQAVEILKVGQVQLVDVPARQILKAHIKAFVGAAVARAAGIHVGLHAHQQHRIEALTLAVASVDLTFCMRGAPGQPPGRVAHEHGGAAVGMHQVAPARRHAPKAMLVETVIGSGAGLAHEGTDLVRQAGIGRRTERAPGPGSWQRRGETHLPRAAAVPEGGAAQHLATFVREVGPYVNICIAVRILLRSSQGQFNLTPGVSEEGRG